MNITINYGTGNSLTRNFTDPVTVGQAIEAARAALGFGNNVEGHLDGVPQPNSTTLQDGDVLSVHDKACAKAAGISVTINYGTGNSLTRQFTEPVTVGMAIEAARAALGFGQNVEGHLDGVPQPNSTTLQDGDTLSVHDKACAKAVGQ